MGRTTLPKKLLKTIKYHRVTLFQHRLNIKQCPFQKTSRHKHVQFSHTNKIRQRIKLAYSSKNLHLLIIHNKWQHGHYHDFKNINFNLFNIKKHIKPIQTYIYLLHKDV